MLTVIEENIQSVARFLQLCAGQTAGGEAAVHAIRKAYQQDDTEGVLLIDASNDFNFLNREVALYSTYLVFMSTICSHSYKYLYLLIC